MDMSPRGSGRFGVALAVLALLAGLVWWTMEPGRFRYVAWLMLGFSAFRMTVLRFRSRYSSSRSLVGRLD